MLGQHISSPLNLIHKFNNIYRTDIAALSDFSFHVVVFIPDQQPVADLEIHRDNYTLLAFGYSTAPVLPTVGDSALVGDSKLVGNSNPVDD